MVAGQRKLWALLGPNRSPILVVVKKEQLARKVLAQQQ